jgi:hypothetical protein
VNLEDSPLETIFMFPKDLDSVMTKITVDFTLQNGSKTTMETEIESCQKAEAKYVDSVASGSTAVLGVIDRDYRDLMRVNIGNFPP